MEEKDKLIKQLADDYNEAIAEIRFNMSTIGLKENSVKRVVKARDLAIKALEKQIPKKIEIRKATNDDIESELRDFITVKGRICRCPSCRCCIHISELKYCWECGQKLDWSDEE